MPSVLALLGDGVEEIEFVTPVDIMRRAGVVVTTASTEQRLEVSGRSALIIRADRLLSEVEALDFDGLFIPGGPGVAALRKNRAIVDLVRRFQRDGKWIFAICAAPLVLKDAGILGGRAFTAHTSALRELPEAVTDRAVVVDGKLVTSRGAGTALPFSLQLVASLVSPDQAKAVADAICTQETG